MKSPVSLSTKRKSTIRFISVFVSVCMVLSLLPMQGVEEARSEFLAATAIAQEESSASAENGSQGESNSDLTEQSSNNASSSIATPDVPSDDSQPNNEQGLEEEQRSSDTSSSNSTNDDSATQNIQDGTSSSSDTQESEPVKAPQSANLADFISSANIEGAQNNDGSLYVREGQDYTVRLIFAERADLQFATQGELTLLLPEGFVPTAGKTPNNEAPRIAYVDENGQNQVVELDENSLQINNGALTMSWEIQDADSRNAEDVQTELATIHSQSNVRIEVSVVGSFAVGTRSVDFGSGPIGLNVEQASRTDDNMTTEGEDEGEAKEEEARDASDTQPKPKNEIEPVALSAQEDTWQESTDLGNFLMNAVVTGATLKDGAYVVEKDKTYGITLTFKEGRRWQFKNDATLTYNLPAGLVVPEDQTKPIEISVVSNGKTYPVPATLEVKTNGTVNITFDQTSENYPRLANANNAALRAELNASFGSDATFSNNDGSVSRQIKVDTEDHGEAYVQKQGYFDQTTGTFNYSITVTSHGNTTNVNVKDVLTGDALIFNNDVQVSGNSSGYTQNTMGSGQKGFDYTFASMSDGEQITITYTAKADFTKDTNNDGKIDFDQTKNTATATYNNKPNKSEYGNEISYWSLSKSGQVSGKSGSVVTATWTVTENPLALVSMAGSSFTDKINKGNAKSMTYSGTGPTIKVYDSNGTLVDTRTPTWAEVGANTTSATQFTYNYPSTDKNYKYEYTYTTAIDTAGASSDTNVTNEGTGKYGSTTAGLTIPNNDKMTITKKVESVNSQEVTWSSVIHVPYNDGDGLATAVVTDDLPHSQLPSYGWANGIDAYKDGSLKVEGLLDGEAYTVDSTSDPSKVIIAFTKDGQPGLKGVNGGHNITVTLTTTVNQDWVNDTESNDWLQKHKNTIGINGTTATAEATLGKSGVTKYGEKLGWHNIDHNNDGQPDTIFKYTVVLKNLYDDSMTLEDQFDTSIFEILDDTTSVSDNLKLYGGDQYNQYSGPSNVTYSNTSTGATFTCNGTPHNNDGSPCSYFKLVYYLRLKDNVDLEDLAAQAGGTYTIQNTAKWNGHEDSSEYEVKYDPLTKECTKEASNSDRYASYRITYNPKKATLNNGEPITLTDLMNEHLSIDHSSVKVWVNDAEDNTDPHQVTYTFSGERVDGVATGATIGEFTVPDEAKIVIEYRAMVIGSGSFEYKNTVDATGSDGKTVTKWANMDSSGGGTASQLSIKVSKVDGYNAAQKLAGVQFKLYSATGMSLYSVGAHAGEKVAIIETDQNGILDISADKYGFSLIEGEKYFLEEVNPPAGYQRLGFPYQFTLTEDMSKVDWDTYTYFNGETFQIKNWPLEGLVVEKVVDSTNEADLNAEYTFQVSILDGNNNVDTSVNTTYGDMEFQNGVATFKLKNNQQMGAYDMPKDTKFRVVETDTKGCTVYVREGSTGEYVEDADATYVGQTIGEGQYTLVSFKNKPVPGALKLKKSVTINGKAAASTEANGTKNRADGDYTFKVKDASGNVAATVVYTIEGGTYKAATINGEAVDASKVSDGYVQVDGLRPGTYTITEETPSNSTTLVGSNDRQVTVKAGDTVDAAGTAEFTNNKVETGEFTLSKELVSNSRSLDANANFFFTVRLSDETINGTYENMTFTNGVTQVTLKEGQTVTAKGLPTGIGYTIQESETENFTLTGITGATTNDVANRKATGTVHLNPATVTFTNTRDEGNLTVSKKVVSNYAPDKAASKKFKFTVTLKDSNLTGTYGSMTFSNGRSNEFELADGQSLTASNLPAGIEYTVTETNDAGFTTTWSGTTHSSNGEDQATTNTGTITKGNDDTIEATNTRKYGGLSVTKQVVSNRYNNEKFDFTATFYTDARRSQVATGVAGTVNVSGGGTAVNFSNGTASFQLGKDQVATFANLPYGLYYTVTETSANQDGWTLQGNTSHTGSITTATASETFTNSKTTGGLTLTKKVTSPSTKDTVDREFTYMVTLKKSNGTNIENGNYGSPAVSFANGVGTVTLKNNQSWTLDGVDAGTTYKIEENTVVGAEYDVSNKVNTTNNTGAIAEGTIEEASTSVVYTNARKLGNLEVSKEVVSDAAADANQEFTFTVRFTDEEGQTINGSFGDMSFANGVASVTLTKGQKATATGLPEGLDYEITEATAAGFELTGITKDGQNQTTAHKATGVVPGNGTSSATFTNTRETAQFSISKVLESDLAADADKEFTYTITLSDGSITKTYSGVSFTAGVATVKLKGGQTKTIEGLPTGITYTITEAETPGFELTGITKKGTHGPSDENPNPVPFERADKDVRDEKLNHHNVTYPDTWTYTNKRTPGDLTLSKSVLSDKSGDAEQTFTFTVKLSDTTISKTYGLVDPNNAEAASQSVEFKDGVATVSITTSNYAGARTIKGLPTSVGYTVTEATATGFTLQGSTSQTGSISTTPSAVEFTNKRNTGNVELSKKLVSEATADASKVFTFTVTLYKEAAKQNVEPLTKTYGDMNFVDGVATVKLKGGQTATAKDLPVGLYYTIEEAGEGDEGYVEGFVTTNTGDTGEIKTGTVKAEFTNTRQTGGLKVSKHVTSSTPADKNKEFAFSVTLTGAPITGKYGDMDFKDGMAMFSLKDGQFKEASGLPTDVEYKVLESGELGFTTWDGTTADAEEMPTEGTSKNPYTTGTISTTAQEKVFSNRRDEGNLCVSKLVNSTYGPDNAAEYDFTVTLTPALAGTYGTGATAMTFNSEGKATFKLKKDEYKEAVGLPAGTKYTVSETGADGMTTTWEGVTKSTTDADDEGTTTTGKQAGTITAGNRDAITATNARDYGDLEVTKTVASHTDADYNTQFDFTLAFYNDANYTQKATTVAGSYTITRWGGSKQTGTFTGGQTTFKLAHGEKLEIKDLPQGIYYKVQEAANGDFITTQTGETGKLVKVNAAKFTNTRSEGGLFVTKTVRSSIATDLTQDFDFTVTLYTDAALTRQATINGTYGRDDGSNDSGAMTFANGKATFKLKNGEMAYAFSLPKGLYYKVEEATPDAFTVSTGTTSSNPSVASGQIVQGSDSNVSYVNTRKKGNLEVTKALLNPDRTPSSNTTKEFRFTVELADKTINGTFGQMTFVDGIATFTLKNGETKSTADTTHQSTEDAYYTLPIGMRYKVTETHEDGYTTSWTNTTGNTTYTYAYDQTWEAYDPDEPVYNPVEERRTITWPGGSNTKTQEIHYGDDGTINSWTKQDASTEWVVTGDTDGSVHYPAITQNTTDNVTFSNAPDVGPLTVYKTVESDLSTDRQKDFQFRVVLEDPTISGTYGSMTFTPNGSVSEASFTLKDGQSKTATGLPRGTRYRIYETPQSGLMANDSNVAGLVGYGLDGEIELPYSQSLVNMHYVTEADDDGNREVIPNAKTDVRRQAGYNNMRELGKLSVGKTVRSTTASDKSSNKKFHYVVTLYTDSELNNKAADIDGVYPLAYYDGGLEKWVWDDVEWMDEEQLQSSTVTFTQGVAEFDLAHGEQIHIGALPSSLYYKVEETADDDFVTTWNNATGMVGNEGGVSDLLGVMADCTNERKEGGLIVSKKLVSDRAKDADQEFNFTVELTDDLGKTLSGDYGEMTFSEGKATFALRGGQSKTAEGLPEDVQYTVSEAGVTGFVTTYTNNKSTGTIVDDATDVVECVNTREKGDLWVSKEVVSDRAADHNEREFAFTVRLGDTSINGKYGDLTFANGVATVSLKDTQTVKATGLPTDVTYTVNEASTAGFSITGQTTVDKDGEHANTNSGTIYKTNAATAAPNVTFQNTRLTGDLRITKQVVSERAADANKEFAFTVRLSDTSIGGNDGKAYGKADDADTYGLTFKNGVATVKLKDGQSASAKDLPVDVTYTVTEEPVEDFSLTSNTGYTGIITTATSAAQFVNTRETGDLEVEKIFTSNAHPNEEYEFHVRLDDQGITGTYGDMVFQNHGTLETPDVYATVSLKAGEKKAATGLPREVQYKVTEHLTNEQKEYIEQQTGLLGVEGTIGATTSKATITNAPIEGGLLIYKNVTSKTDADLGKEFEFEVLLKDGHGDPVNEEVGGVTFTNGKATVKLRHDQTKSISPITAGYTYEVREVLSDADKALYNTTARAGDPNATVTDGVVAGTIADKISSASYTNSRKNGGFDLSKQLVSDRAADADQEFTFTVTLAGDEGEGVNGTFGTNDETQGLKAITFANGVGTVKLKGGQKVRITKDNGLPAGIAYTITEAAAEGFELEGITTNGTKDEATRTAAGTISDVIDATTEYENKRQTGSLELTKQVVSPVTEDKDPNTQYSFTVRLSDTSINKTYDVVATDVSGRNQDKQLAFQDGVATVTLAHDQWASAANMPTGVTYTITESNVSYGANSRPASNAFTITNDHASGSIVKDQTVTATYTNTRETTQTSVRKVWEDEFQNEDDKYGLRPNTLDVTLHAKSAGNEGNPIAVRTADIEIPVSGLTVTLSKDDDPAWQKTFENLPKFDYDGNAIEYSWSEDNVPTGYTLSGPVMAGTQSTLTNTLNVGAVKIRKTFTGLPDDANTGGLSFTITPYTPDAGTPYTVAYADFTNGEYVVAEDVPEGWKYQVEETNAEGLVANYTLLSTSVIEGEETVAKGETKVIELVNNYQQDTGTIKIRKSFAGLPQDADVSRLEFRITPPAGEPYTVAYDKFDANGEYTVVEGVPVGQEYKVEETNAKGLVANYTLLSTSKTQGEATPVKDQTTYVDLNNDYEQDLGSVRIHKTFTGLPANANVDGLEFQITKPDGSEETVSYADFDQNGYYTVAENVPVGQEYKVKETNAEGLVTNYTLLPSSVTEGEATPTKSQTATIELANDYEQDKGSLCIMKTFSGIPSDANLDNLEFEVTGPDDYHKTIKYSEFREGEYVIGDLPIGNTYTVRETNADALIANHTLVSTSVTEGTATMEQKDETVYVDLVNDYVQSDKGRLQIAKRESGMVLTQAQKQAIMFTVEGPEGSSNPIRQERSLADFVERDAQKNLIWTLSDLEVGTYVVTETREHGEWEKGDWSSTSTFSVTGGKATIEKEEVTKISVSNVYASIKGIVNLKASKQVEASEDVPYEGDETFRFTLSKAGVSTTVDGSAALESDSLPNATTIDVKNGETGSWGDIGLTEEGIYYYLITEQVPETKTVGMTYRSEPLWVKVDASAIDDPVVYYGNSKQEVDAKSGESEESGVVGNTYVLGDLTVTKDVAVEGEEIEGVDSHEFKVTVQNEEGKYLNVSYDTEGNQTVTYEDDPAELPVSKETPLVIERIPNGTYTVTETETNRSVDLYTFEEDKSNTSGSDSIALNKDAQINLLNTYTQQKGKAEIKVAKQVQGDEYNGDEEFEFKLEDLGSAEGEDSPMPANETVKVKASETASFGSIDYTRSGDYYYKVTEVRPEVVTEGMTYSTKAGFVRVSVDAALNTKVYYAETEDDVESVDEAQNPLTIDFVNTYELPEENKANVDLQATKKLSGRELKEGEFSFELKNEDGEVLQTKKNDASGAVLFDTLTYTEEDVNKIFVYTISEVKENAAYVSYDEHEGKVAVAVARDTNGKVIAAAAYDEKVGNTFNNVYTPPQTPENPKTPGTTGTPSTSRATNTSSSGGTTRTTTAGTGDATTFASAAAFAASGGLVLIAGSMRRRRKRNAQK